MSSLLPMLRQRDICSRDNVSCVLVIHCHALYACATRAYVVLCCAVMCLCASNVSMFRMVSTMVCTCGSNACAACVEPCAPSMRCARTERQGTRELESRPPANNGRHGRMQHGMTSRHDMVYITRRTTHGTTYMAYRTSNTILVAHKHALRGVARYPTWQRVMQDMHAHEWQWFPLNAPCRAGRMLLRYASGATNRPRIRAHATICNTTGIRRRNTCTLIQQEFTYRSSAMLCTSPI